MGRNAHFHAGATEASAVKPNYNKIGSLEMNLYGHTFSNPDDPAGANRQLFATREANGLDRLSGQPLGHLYG